MQGIRVINTVLAVILFALVINLFEPLTNVAGNVIYNLDVSNPQCYFSGNMQIPIDMCCYEIREMITCKTLPGFDYKCYNSESSKNYYLIDHKALSYCKKEGYDVKVT